MLTKSFTAILLSLTTILVTCGSSSALVLCVRDDGTGHPKPGAGITLETSCTPGTNVPIGIAVEGTPGTDAVVRIQGANLQVVSGGGSTDAAVNGLGNLIVGYNENPHMNDRAGSHNLVVGAEHWYSSYGGLVAGEENAITAPSASVSGGLGNHAGGDFASVSGGFGNVASGATASVAGGFDCEASGEAASVSGGLTNLASGDSASVSGGAGNEASGYHASVSGGDDNAAIGLGASVSGGYRNRAVAEEGSVSGGQCNYAGSGRPPACSVDTSNSAGASVSGGQFNQARAYNSSVTGGSRNRAKGPGASVTGGASNVSSGARSVVSGGRNRSVSGSDDWRGGSLFEGN